ncbi:MAG: hypothetical protein RLY71_3604 [Pseudomonadota bacterium]|jgi:hypothetical protein
MPKQNERDSSPRQENGQLKKYKLDITFKSDAITLVQDCSAKLAPIAQKEGISKFIVTGPDKGVTAENKDLVITTKESFVLNISVFSEKSESDKFQFTVCGLVWLPQKTSTVVTTNAAEKHGKYKTSATTGFGKPVMCKDDSVSVEIDPKKISAGSEYFILVQAPNGAFGIVDPRMTTR